MIKINKNFFNKIDTEEKAYWLGFIWADGHVSVKAPWFLVVQIKDRDHLEKLCESLEYEGTIKVVHGSGYNPDAVHYRVAFCRKTLCEDLNNLGRNSCKEKFPLIHNDLKRHFLRGYFDGDGCIHTGASSSSGKKYTYLHANFIAENNLALNIQDFLLENNVSSVIHDSKTDHMKYVKISGGNNMRCLHKLMYDNATVFLNRKNVLWQYLYGAHGEKSLLKNPEYAGTPLESNNTKQFK